MIVQKVSAFANKAMRLSRSRQGRLIWLVVTQRLVFRSPRTLNEKIRYKMRFDRSPHLQQAADKLGLRTYVEQIAAPVRLPVVYSVWTDAAQVDVSSIPEQCVLKPSHASGPVIVVSTEAPRSAALVGLRRHRGAALLPDWRRSKVVVHPADVSQRALTDLVRRWLRWDYYEYRGRSEFAYFEMPRSVIVEELLRDDAGPLDDVKVWCANGVPRLIQLDSARFGDHRQSLFTPEGQPVAATLGIAKAHDRRGQIPRRSEVVEVARMLSEPFDFVRVDLYVADETVILGELTHYPNGGAAPFGSSQQIDSLFADWQPDLRYGPRGEHRG